VNHRFVESRRVQAHTEDVSAPLDVNETMGARHQSSLLFDWDAAPAAFQAMTPADNSPQ
jgi:hypothetical protein